LVTILRGGANRLSSLIRTRAAAVGIFAPIGNHSFRATGITGYLSNGGALEHAQEMAAHERVAGQRGMQEFHEAPLD
jgi:hypothetical protein